MAKEYSVYLRDGTERDFPVYLRGGTDQIFQVYLHDTLTGGDILIYSIPFREYYSFDDGIVVDCGVSGYELHKFISALNGIEIDTQAELASVKYIRVAPEILIASDVHESAVKYFTPEDASIVFDAGASIALIEETSAYDDIVIHCGVDSYVLRKIISAMCGFEIESSANASSVGYETASNVIEISTVANTAGGKYPHCDDFAVEFDAYADATVLHGHYRLLGEMDTDTLSDYDSMTLSDVDYIISNQ